ncbi:hypothetical protein VNI00_014171 [Paramarasmius palmivorus]|uniref:Uncharacterized protein n=1 Tax=Paramarasmius palmivorus TaxID=297713 RepID=A0AAW0BWN9_9AGAR
MPSLDCTMQREDSVEIGSVSGREESINTKEIKEWAQVDALTLEVEETAPTPAAAIDFPDGGLRAWLIVVGAACGCAFAPMLALIGQWFRKRRGLAMGLVATGSSVGGTVFPIATRRLIAEVGFPWAMRILGFILLFCLAIPNLTLARRLPPKHANGGMLNLAAFKFPPFTIWALAAFVNFLGLYTGMSLFLAALSNWVMNIATALTYIDISAVKAGISEDFSFYLVAIANASSGLGRITAGFLADRIGPINFMAPTTLIAGILTFAWPFARTQASFVVISVIYGFMTGSYVSSFMMPLFAMGEMHDIGRRSGMVLSIGAIGALVGPPISGAINHATGGFEAVGYYAAHASEHNTSLKADSKTINFKDEEAQRCVTEALLHRDFHLKIRIPKDRLCPPVPNRLNYLLWIQDIVRACPVVERSVQGIVGVDIGTGSSAIYPLLGCRLEPSWKFVATEVDETSFRSAEDNIKINALCDRIRVAKASPNGPTLLPLISEPSSTFTFTMCNPPFYGSAEEVAQSAEVKEFEPNAICTGAPVEMITVGGESAFVRKMIHESKEASARCMWYTSMLGKLSSVGEVVEALKEYTIDNYAITEFVQGQTRRWAIGWSFTEYRLPDAISRLSSPNPTIQQYIPPHNTIRQPIPACSNVDLDAISSRMAQTGGVTTTRKPNYLLVQANGDGWSRAARRRKQPPIASTAVAMVCTIAILEGHAVFQWVKGRDRSLFESFCSHVSRKLLVSNAK